MLPRTGDDNSKRRSSSSDSSRRLIPVLTATMMAVLAATAVAPTTRTGSRRIGIVVANAFSAARTRPSHRHHRSAFSSSPPRSSSDPASTRSSRLFSSVASEPASSGKTSSKDDDDDHVDGRLFSEEINVLYDSKCNVCKLEMDWLVSRDVRLNGSDRPRLKLTDLEDDYDATDPSNGGIDYATGMAAIYAVKHDGTVYKGVPVFEMAYDQVGLGWIWRINRVPAVNRFLEWGYEIFARNRTRITRGTPLEELLALHAAQRKDLDDGGCESCGTKHENNRLS
mmetsp:Transcript_25340/g.59313  ORF Transcript_25340/g.59313 Transcript_25340/m.59313 type:complete len:282 (+) Transcript_25340:222-1067(+)